MWCQCINSFKRSELFKSIYGDISSEAILILKLTLLKAHITNSYSVYLLGFYLPHNTCTCTYYSFYYTNQYTTNNI